MGEAHSRTYSTCKPDEFSDTTEKQVWFAVIASQKTTYSVDSQGPEVPVHEAAAAQYAMKASAAKNKPIFRMLLFLIERFINLCVQNTSGCGCGQFRPQPVGVYRSSPAAVRAGGETMDLKKLGLTLGLMLMLVAPMAFATYSGTYVADDMDDISFDVLGAAGVALIPFVSLIILLVVLRFGAGALGGILRNVM